MMRTRSPRKVDDIPIAPSLYSLSNKMGNSLLAVRDINHKYIVVERGKTMVIKNIHKQPEEGKQAKRLIYQALVRKLNAPKAAAKS